MSSNKGQDQTKQGKGGLIATRWMENCVVIPPFIIVFDLNLAGFYLISLLFRFRRAIRENALAKPGLYSLYRMLSCYSF